MKVLPTLILVAAAAGCSSISLPVSGVTSDGSHWTGYFTVEEFTIANGTEICKGRTPMGTEANQTAPFSCNDGRTGTATTNRKSLSGGTVDATFSDGTRGSFVYGS